MEGTIFATTASGAAYVLAIDEHGVRWFRTPGPNSRVGAASGWQETVPRVLPGERLLLGDLLSTPVSRVAFLPDAGQPGRRSEEKGGWGGRIRTFGLLIQSQAPYRLATPQWVYAQMERRTR